uniref:Venom polypeptide n=1 Tax=Dolopus genitalis TaxID=2488630 RepID=A0A3G5BIJ6_DOLGE|nr:venom polypeptide [Dolopus genitalis]
MKFELFIFLISAIFVAKGQEATYSLSEATKLHLLKLVEGVTFMSERAAEILQNVEFQMKSFNSSANMNLTEVHTKISKVLDDVSSNKEYKKCIDRERMQLRFILQKARADVNQCLRAGIIRGQVLRNNTIQPLLGIRLNHFIQKCFVHEKNECTEQEAAVVKEEAQLAIKMAYDNLYKAGGELKPLANKVLQCLRNIDERTKSQAKSFLDATMKRNARQQLN